MTAIDRFDPFERRITNAMDEIAASRPPAYLNDILRQTARTSQRPRWTFPERWLPVDAAFTRGRPIVRLDTRQLALVALVGLLAALAAAYIAGASRPDPAFGPAGNGLLAYTSENDLYLAEQQGAPRLLAAGVGFGPLWSRDGSHVATIRPVLIRNHQLGSLRNGPNYCARAQPTCVDEIVITDLDGRSIVAATLAHDTWLMDWSADGRQLLVENKDPDAIDAGMNAVLVSVDGTAPKTIGRMFGGINARFSPVGATPILYLAEDDTGRVVLRSADGHGLPVHDLAATTPAEATLATFDVSPDGASVALAADGTITVLHSDGSVDWARSIPGIWSVRYSPDGVWLLIDGAAGKSELLRADGSSAAEPVSADRQLSGCQWAPDGTLMLCQDEGAGVWSVDLATRTSTLTTLSSAGWQWAPGISWQRILNR